MYTSCYHANLGLFQTFLTSEDVVLSDVLNHASIIDGLMLCKARKMVYKHLDMQGIDNAHGSESL